jgi:hypothetical protein
VIPDRDPDPPLWQRCEGECEGCIYRWCPAREEWDSLDGYRDS